MRLRQAGSSRIRRHPRDDVSPTQERNVCGLISKIVAAALLVGTTAALAHNPPGPPDPTRGKADPALYEKCHALAKKRGGCLAGLPKAPSNRASSLGTACEESKASAVTAPLSKAKRWPTERPQKKAEATMFARIAVMRALNRHAERVFNPRPRGSSLA